MPELSREDIERLVRIEEASKRLEMHTEALIARVAEDRADARKRLRALEKWAWGLAAAAAVGGASWVPQINQLL